LRTGWSEVRLTGDLKVETQDGQRGPEVGFADSKRVSGQRKVTIVSSFIKACLVQLHTLAPDPYEATAVRVIRPVRPEET